MLTIDDFLDPKPSWGSRIEIEIKNRIKLSIAAYAYEFTDDVIITDAEFDELCGKIDINIKTGNEEMDAFFEEKFDPSTGQWIHSHPQLSKIRELHEKYYKG